MAASQTVAFRIQRDLREVYTCHGNGGEGPPIFVVPCGDRIDKVLALIIGPPDTPYEGTFFFFDFQFPPTYPNSPPKVKLLTTDSGRVRFNPNLYSDGKVCLSILGTWRGESGGSENWRSSFTLAYTLQCIQCLIMNAEPFFNEPGFEKESMKTIGTHLNTSTFGLSWLKPYAHYAALAQQSEQQLAAMLNAQHLSHKPGAKKTAVNSATTGSSSSPQAKFFSQAHFLSLAANNNASGTPIASSPPMLPSPQATSPAPVGDLSFSPETSVTTTPVFPGSSSAFSSPTHSFPPTTSMTSGDPLAPPQYQHQQHSGDDDPTVSGYLAAAESSTAMMPPVLHSNDQNDHQSIGEDETASMPDENSTEDDDSPAPATSLAANTKPVPMPVSPPPLPLARLRILKLTILCMAHNYAEKIAHESLRCGVCDVMESLLGLIPPPRPGTECPSVPPNNNTGGQHNHHHPHHPPSSSSSGPPPSATAPPVFRPSSIKPLPAAEAFEAELKRQYAMRSATYHQLVKKERFLAVPPPATYVPEEEPEETLLSSSSILDSVELNTTSSPDKLAHSAEKPSSSSAAPPAVFAAPTMKDVTFTPLLDGTAFNIAPFEGSLNWCQGTFNYKWLEARLCAIDAAMTAELEALRLRGTEHTAKKVYASSMLLEEAQHLGGTVENVCGGPASPDNAFHWQVSFMPYEGVYEDSCYTCDIDFNEDCSIPPRARFRQPIFHPNISPDGVPCYMHNDYSIAANKRNSPLYVIGQIRKLLVAPPVHRGGAILNQEAASLCFSASDEERKMFKKKARQLARRTLE